jgi:hypothetical protein
MARGTLPALVGLDVADAPEVWRRLGFSVDPGGGCVIGGVRVSLRGTGAGTGIVGWTLRAAAPVESVLDGIPTATVDSAFTEPGAAHANGATGIDHVVVHTPDLQRTLAVLTSAGLQVRRIREASDELHQAFLWAGEVLVEVAGPPEPTGTGAARLWGLVVVAPDLDRLTAPAGGPLGSVRDAVQGGRRIGTVRRELGSSVPLAFMTPHPRRADTPEE